MRGEEESASSREEKCLRGWEGGVRRKVRGVGARGAGRAWDARREAQGVVQVILDMGGGFVGR